MNNHCARILLSVLAVWLVVGCSDGPESDFPAMTRHTLSHDGLEREYFVFLPSGYDANTAYPAAVFMHGYGHSATGTDAEVTHGLTRYAEEYGYVLILPQSTWFMLDGSPDARREVTSWNHISDGFDSGPAGPICAADAVVFPCPPECGTCGRCGWASCHDDVGFLEALVARFTSDLSVDEDRIYASGFGNGAMMSNRIACEASEVFAAIALVAGRVEPGFECAPEIALPLLQINGARDTMVPHDGKVSELGYYYASAEAIADQWNEGAACASERKAWQPRVGKDALRCTITCAGTPHESIDCLWPEGDHRWPGTTGRRDSDGYCVTALQSISMPDQAICAAPDPSQDVWGSRLMFEFFDAHVRNRP